MAVLTGKKAISFALPAKPGEMIDLSEHFGKHKVVLLFFPLAFSGVCTKEMCHFRDSWDQWQELGAKVFGISIDSPFVTDKFREVENIPFPILSDFNKEVARDWEALHEDLKGMKGVTKRAAFVIDSNGDIVYDWISDDPSVQVDFEAIKSAVESAA